MVKAYGEKVSMVIATNLLLSVASVRKKLLKATHTEEGSVNTNSERIAEHGT